MIPLFLQSGEIDKELTPIRNNSSAELTPPPSPSEDLGKLL